MVNRLRIEDKLRGSARNGGGMLAATDSTRGASFLVALAVAVVSMTFPTGAHASFLPPELMDKAAFYLAWFILICMPIGGILLFWMVHVLPEKIAHKRHHPQRDAIQTLCLLSLVFGGMLWPLAWLWAYTKPVSHQMAYGTDKHLDYFDEMGEKALAGQLNEHEIAQLRHELDAMAAKGNLPARLRLLRMELAEAKVALAASVAANPPPTAAGAKEGTA